MPHPRELAPTQTAERVELLDAVRGLALFGIVSANMILYSLYLYLPDAAKRAMATHASDRVLDFVELFLIEGKFYTIFSILFGVGFSVLLSRTRAKGPGISPVLSEAGRRSVRDRRRARGPVLA
jgi:uncharacterized protein